MNKYFMLLMGLCLSACSDPASQAKKNIKDGCILATNYSNTAIKLCECVADKMVDQLSDDEIKLFDKDINRLSQRELFMMDSIMNKMTKLDLQQCNQ